MKNKVKTLNIINDLKNLKPPTGECLYKVKLSILDTYGVALSATVNRDYKQILSFNTKNDIGQSYIWGSNKKISASNATFLNIYAGHRYDFDSILYGTFGHPSVILYPALFALYDQMEFTGDNLLKSMLIGLETMNILGIEFGEGLRKRGLHPTSVLGGIGISVAIGEMLDFSENKMLSSMDLVGGNLSGFKSSFGSIIKPYQVAAVGRDAVEKVLLINQGLEFNSNGRYLDNLSILSGKSEYFNDYKNIERWVLENENFLYKQYPCCGYFHHVMDGLINLIKVNGINKVNIEKIELVLPEYIGIASKYDKPQNVEEAKFSIHFNLALILVNEIVSISNYTEEELSNLLIKAAMEKIFITYIDDEKAIDYSANIIKGSLKIKMKDSRVYNESIVLSDNGSAVDYTKISEKFYNCTKSILNYEKVTKLIDSIMDIDKSDSISWNKIHNDVFK